MKLPISSKPFIQFWAKISASTLEGKRLARYLFSTRAPMLNADSLATVVIGMLNVLGDPSNNSKYPI